MSVELLPLLKNVSLMLLTLLSGAAGGVTYWLRHFVQEMQEERVVATSGDMCRQRLALLTQALVGCSGALAISLVLFMVGKFPVDQNRDIYVVIW